MNPAALAKKADKQFRKNGQAMTFIQENESEQPNPDTGQPEVENIHGVMQFVACDTVPSAVKRACIELAALFIAGEDPLAPIERGGRVASETVGPISTSYFDDAASETLYPAVSGLVWAFLREIPGQSGSISGFAETGRA